MPLALEQAAAWLDRSQMPGQEYLQLLRSRGAELYARGQVSDRADTIATLWDISVGRIIAENLATVQLLGVCAYLAPEPIPLRLFTAHTDLLPEPLSSAAADRLAFSEAIAVLVDYSLAKRTPAGLQLHRLVQATIRDRYASPDTCPQTHQEGPAPMADQETESPVDFLAVALGLLRADAPAEIVSAPQNWPRWTALLPHTLAATGHASSQSDPAVMEVVTWLLVCAGVYLQEQAQLTDAKALLERALVIDEAAYGPDHPGVARDLNTLANILRQLGQLDGARLLQERALAIDEAVYGPDHPGVARDLNTLAWILWRLGQPEAARLLQERALAIDEAVYGPDHPGVARDLNNLARILLELGQPEAARLLQERALAIDEAVYGPDHPDVARNLNNLARILLELGQPEAARTLQERALAINEATYGIDHPDVARDLNSLAGILLELGQPEAARTLQERALAISQASRSGQIGS